MCVSLDARRVDTSLKLKARYATNNDRRNAIDDTTTERTAGVRRLSMGEIAGPGEAVGFGYGDDLSVATVLGDIDGAGVEAVGS
jgi:hypothetical protein